MLIKAEDVGTWGNIYATGIDDLRIEDSKADTDSVLMEIDPALIRNNGGWVTRNYTLTGGSSDGGDDGFSSGFDSGFG